MKKLLKRIKFEYYFRQYISSVHDFANRDWSTVTEDEFQKWDTDTKKLYDLCNELNPTLMKVRMDDWEQKLIQ
jgi:hypothetical protein